MKLPKHRCRDVAASPIMAIELDDEGGRRLVVEDSDGARFAIAYPGELVAPIAVGDYLAVVDGRQTIVVPRQAFEAAFRPADGA